MTARLTSRWRDGCTEPDRVAVCVGRSWSLMAQLASTLTGPIGLALRWQGPRPMGMVLPAAVQAAPQCCAGRSRPVPGLAPSRADERPKRWTGLQWTGVCGYIAQS